jgi:tight adherence protein B
VQAQLRGTGVALPARDVIQLWLATTGAVAFVLAAVSPVMALAGVVMIVAATPAVPVALRRRQNHARIAALPSLLDDVAHHLRAGGTVLTALDGIAASAHAFAGDCATAVARTRAGLTLEHALIVWAGECGGPGARAVAGALGVAAQTGGQSAVALDGMAAGLRDEQAVAAESAALAAQARLSAAVVALAPLGFLGFSALTGGGAANFLTRSAIGRACFGCGVALDALAAMWMRRIVRVAP